MEALQKKHLMVSTVTEGQRVDLSASVIAVCLFDRRAIKKVLKRA